MGLTRGERALRMIPLVQLTAKPVGKLRFVVGELNGLTEGHNVWCDADLTAWHCDCRWMAIHPGDMCAHAQACLLYLERGMKTK
jgi:hypothetical protein